MSNIQEAITAIKIRIAFIGHPNEPKDWSKEIALMDAILLESEPEPTEFTEEYRKYLKRGVRDFVDSRETEHAVARLLVKGIEACDIIDRQASELKKAYGRITALSLKEGRVKIADIYQEQQAENADLKKAIEFLLDASAPMTSQQEECWPLLKQALKRE